MTNGLDYNKSEQYTLSIRLSTDGFSFSIYNPISGGDFYHRTYPINTQRSMAANVKAFLAATEELKHKFKHVNILVHSQRYTIVPLELFEDEQMENIFYQNVKEIKNETVLCNILGKSNSVILFSLDKLAHLLLSEHFTSARFFSSISPQIEYLSAKSRQGNSRKMYVNIHTENIDVICINKGRLLLVNSYLSPNCSDIIYYILNIWKNLEYDQRRDELHITGRDETRKEIIKELQKYISHVYSINPHAEFTSSEYNVKIEDIPFDIQSLILCE